MAARNRSLSPPIPAGPRIVRAELRMLRLPVVESLDAGHGPTTGTFRDLTVVALHGDNGATGWGECAALGTAGYWHETASSAFGVLAAVITGLTGGPAHDLIDPSTVSGLDPATGPMAAAAVEMAALDLFLRSAGRSLGDWLGAIRSVVPAGAAVGLGPADQVADRVVDLATEGYRRVKVKIEPDTAETVVRAVAERLGQLFDLHAGRPPRGFELHVDANGTYPPRDHEYGGNDDAVAALVGLAHLGVDVIEQPFTIDDESSARALRTALVDAGLTTLVVADEAVDSLAAARASFGSGAADGVVIKPSRLGGLEAARRTISAMAADGAAVSVGGMVESALGRRSLAAVAAIDGVTKTGDLSPARRWLSDDPWPDLETTTVDGGLHVLVPTSPGVAPPPDPDDLDRLTVERVATGD